MDLITLLTYFELIGVVAFAISGALVGINKELDIFGVIFLSIITAVGGGIFRDIAIGNTPPTSFINPLSSFISMLTGFIVFFTHKKIIKFSKVILITDALWLSVFSVIGCRTAIVNGANSLFVAVVTGLSTGIGGGILRDVFVNNIPYVLKKEIYAIASIIGALSYFYISKQLSEVLSLYICATITFIIRIISLKFNVSLPVRKL